MSETTLTVNNSGYLSVPMRLRERHLTEDSEGAEVRAQAIGPQLQVIIPSDRNNLLLRMPLSEWRAGPPRKRSLYKGGVYVDRWIDQLVTDEEGTVQVELSTIEGDADELLQ